MTKAVLYGYKLYQISEDSTPVIAPSDDSASAVDGMLVFNLDESKRNGISELESGLTHLKIIQAELTCKHKFAVIDAGVFVWSGSVDGLIPIESTFWEPTKFVISSFYGTIKESIYRSANDVLDSEKEKLGNDTWAKSCRSERGPISNPSSDDYEIV
ncbi:uncharacterized protein N7482_006615 [Penicillium canariense]|uniref:Gamma-glutamylcyclotransferase AIG2-like domain-containing protein n=1 Tax=Penicillium canariense TaxID=189055 RepID=A0A9W9HXI0_9EURO|nr:uncharacterized protein N7482_006615 [Penicillium canariense]KAJ5159611.1 hypothetical protein N7482_006615 [Penicillium canariense]